MQKIIINNFLSVAKAEIVIPKMLVLIGEQASGKSTIAKLIYFFKSLSQNLFTYIYQSETSFDFEKDILHQIKFKFYELFGTETDLQKFNIKYYYDIENEKYLQLFINETNELIIKFSNNMFTEDIIKEIYELKEMLSVPFNNFEDELNGVVHDNQKKITYEKLFKLLEATFNNSNNPLFIPAGRAMTETYSNLFANVSDINSSEILMSKFLQRVIYMKSYFSKNNNFEEAIKTYFKNTNNHKSQLYPLNRDIEQILNSKGYMTNISNLSTGQKEVIRILQDILMSMLTNESVFRVIEEPETNLHPITQKNLTELLCLLANDNKNNQIVITTNSPYVLTVLNNLLLASKVVKYDDIPLSYIDKYIPIEYHLNPDEFSIYSLGNKVMEQDYCVNIIGKSGLISQNYLDIISELLSNDFQILYKLYSEIIKKIQK